MYTLCVEREFVAQHFLIGGYWGAENERHSRAYLVAVELEAIDLDEHGFVADILQVEDALQKTIDEFQDKTLNELPIFDGLNPSLEHFATVFCKVFLERFFLANLSAITVKVWEDNIAWASYRGVRGEAN